MKLDMVQSLLAAFEGHAQQTESGVNTGSLATFSSCSAISSGETSSRSSRRLEQPVRRRITTFATILLTSTKWSSSAPVAAVHR
jgi:hypothetical protein